jgi:hypothetical protein
MRCKAQSGSLDDPSEVDMLHVYGYRESLFDGIKRASDVTVAGKRTYLRQKTLIGLPRSPVAAARVPSGDTATT